MSSEYPPELLVTSKYFLKMNSLVVDTSYACDKSAVAIAPATSNANTDKDKS